jgi:hypothetical protein
MKVLITGDVHAEFGILNKLISRRRPDLVICCGDFGVWPTVYPMTVKLQSAKKLLFCDGNHENHWYLKELTNNEISPGIIYMPRGSVYTLPDGRNIMFMGGARSIDKVYRKLGVDWFPEEEITQSDLMDLPDINIDIFITHTCPEEIVPVMRQWVDARKQIEPSNIALTQLWKMYKPSLWYFGHWHSYMEGDINGITKWFCLDHSTSYNQWWTWLEDK